MDPATRVHEAFLAALANDALPAPATTDLGALTAADHLTLFRSMIESRQLDRMARAMQARGEGFYTIGSSGHEAMAAVAAALRTDDMAFLHYRDAAFQLHRARIAGEQDALYDMALSFAASAEDPISGGRHKVLGSKSLAIPPQTSTIASHLPKAVGAAFSIGIARALGQTSGPLADDGVILASFGDASANHSTAQGAFNTACWAAYQGTPMPIVFVCEDNGIGISVRTPGGWIAANFAQRPALKYLACDGRDLAETFRAASEAAHYARNTRRPVILHLTCQRLYGHAGSDVQDSYLTKEEIARAEAADPLAHAAARIASEGLMTRDQIAALYLAVGEACDDAAERACARPGLTSADDVMASLIPPPRPRPPARAIDREGLFASDRALIDKPQPMAKLISWTLAEEMARYPEIVVAGEDVGAKGGVYGATNKLQQRHGRARVIDTLLDEQAILGLGIGLAHNGLVPVCEIQFLAYVHNAEDQLRGEAATLPFFSNGQFANGMVVRIAGLPYQKGFGGHFHNDNSLAVFRDIPGLIVAVPSNARDAVAMLRECIRLAREDQRVVVFVEPIALYNTRDLLNEGDGLMAATFGDIDEPVSLGEVGTFGDGTDLAIVTYGNGAYLSRQAIADLASQGIAARVIDLRWLAPLPVEEMLAAIGPCQRVLVVDECRETGSLSEALMAHLAERAPALLSARIAAKDSFIPLGKAATLTLPSREAIVEAALQLASSRA